MSNVILVAGGAGFIGSNLSAVLLASGHRIICIDNFTTSSKQNLTPLLSHRNFTLIKGDICAASLIKNFRDQQLDQIYHLASPASVGYITQYPTQAALANSVGTKNLLDLARLKRVKILFASSSEVYGDPKQHPQKEEYWGNVNPVGIRSGYDEGKRFGEALCIAYHREFGLDIRIVRVFNTYGPYSSTKDTRVIPHFITQALQNKPLTVHGDGSQTRSFCYVSDMVDGFVKTMEQAVIGPFNLGNPDEHQIINVAKLIIRLTSSKSIIEFSTRPEDDPSVREPDISLAKKMLKWTPYTSFAIGLSETIEYFKKIL